MHEQYMKCAIEQAVSYTGKVMPNPRVGSVIVKDGRIISRGFHRGPGSIHAEADALSKTDEDLSSAVMYCTLEPCCIHYPGKVNPPCAEEIIARNVGTIVVAALDPDIHVRGNGIRMLKNAGKKVVTGVLSQEAIRINREYYTSKIQNKPFVHLKIAQTLDGKIACINKNSKWITDEAARTKVHEIRSCVNGILVGVNTVIDDNPSLTVRYIAGENPVRIIFDSNLKTPLISNVLNDRQARTIIFSASENEVDIQKMTERGAAVYSVARNGRVDTDKALQILWKLKIASIMVEGGSGIFSEFLNCGLYDKITVFIAPILMGNGIHPFKNTEKESVSQCDKLNDVLVYQLNSQAVFEGYRMNFDELEKRCSAEL